MAKPLHCRYCQRRLLPAKTPGEARNLAATRDHLIPKSKGGRVTDWCCRQCNQLKSDMSLIAWARFMRAEPEWWLRFRTHGQVLKADPGAPTKKERRTAAWKLRAIRHRQTTFPFKVAPPPFCGGYRARG